MNRRSFMKSAPFAIAAISTSALVAPPTEEEKALYYSFLWCEFKALSEEMGIDMFDGGTLSSVKGRDKYQAAYGGTLPSARAKIFTSPLSLA